jgi:uncharacterized protein YbjT (DUF2867 family)
MSRRGPKAHLLPQVEWAQVDLATGRGVREAVEGAQIVIHAATMPTPSGKVDVGGTQRLLEAARAVGVEHCVYISIVGIDRNPFFYYRNKLKAEELVRASGVPWSILRATQFYPFIDRILRAAVRGPLLPLAPDLRFQPIDLRDVVRRMVESVIAGPGGQLEDIGGPEVLTLGEMARAWLKARGLRSLIVPLPLPGKAAAAFRRGLNTCPDHAYGAITWQTWLQETYSGAAAPAVSVREHEAKI